jgi:outer membrane lipoprotein carrier protein
MMGLLLTPPPAWGQETDAPTPTAETTPQTEPTLDDILDNVEERYTGQGFSADFHQESTLAAMDITDTATGNLFVRPPDRMRWEYEQPERQVILTDGETLWIWRPEDNQVMIGRAPAYFGDGKGASFLSDIREIRKSFDVSLEPEAEAEPGHYRLKLVPKQKEYDIEAVYLAVSKDTFIVDQVTTHNDYGDITRITFADFTFDQPISDDIFDLDVPPGTDMIQMDGG